MTPELSQRRFMLRIGDAADASRLRWPLTLERWQPAGFRNGRTHTPMTEGERTGQRVRWRRCVAFPAGGRRVIRSAWPRGRGTVQLIREAVDIAYVASPG